MPAGVTGAAGVEMLPEKLNRQVTLSRGRRLGFAEYGDPAGEPVFYFHGWPASRLEPRLIHSLCADLGLRIVAPDRPGIGLSDFQRPRAILDWPADICVLARHLGLSRFHVLGVSGGGPYALACAASIPDRLGAALVVCGFGPPDSPESVREMATLNRRLLGFARRFPGLAGTLACLCMRIFWGRGQRVLPPSIERRLSGSDRLVVSKPEVRQALVDSSTEAFRRGAGGPALDGLLLARPWGFRLEEITIPVRLWHGEDDVVIPPAMGRSVAKLLRQCRCVFQAGEGHFSLPYNHAREILGTIRGG